MSVSPILDVYKKYNFVLNLSEDLLISRVMSLEKLEDLRSSRDKTILKAQKKVNRFANILFKNLTHKQVSYV